MSLTVEEIEKHLEDAKDERELVDLLNSYSYRMQRQDLRYSMELTERAIALSEKLDYRQGLAKALSNKGFSVFYQEGLKEGGHYYLEESERIFRTLPEEEREWLGRTLSGLGSYYMEMADYMKASGYFREALNLAEKFGNAILQGIVYNNLSYIYQSLKQYEKCREYTQKAVRYLGTTTDYNNYVIALNNMGDICYKLGDYSEALDYLRQAEKVVEERGIEFMRGILELTIGEIQLKMGEFDESEKRLLNVLKRYRMGDEKTFKAKSLLQLGELYTLKEEPRRALYYLLRSQSVAKMNSVINIMPEISRLIYLNYKSLGDFVKSLHYFEQYYKLREGEFSLEMEKSIRNVEAESLKRANERIRIISAIGREITATLDLKRVIETIFNRLSTLLEAFSFGIAVYDSSTRMIEYTIYMKGRGLLPSFSYSVESKESFSAYVVRERCDIMMNDIDKEYKNYLEGELSPHKGPKEEEAASALFTPLLIEDEVIGVISVQTYKKEAYMLTDLDTLKALASYIAIALNNARQADLIRQKNDALKRLAITDYLTGIYNRREFEKRVRAFWNISSGKSDYFSILLLDADHFKQINDNYGHPAGDECLKQLAALLKDNITGSDDCLARYGGEEFIVLLNCSSKEALEVAERIRSGVEALTIKYEGGSFALTVSIGVSTTLVSTINATRGPEQLISRADEALYRSKMEGRNRVTYLDF